MFSTYESLLNEIKTNMCKACKGTGKQDNCDGWDVASKEWICPNCNGTGLKKELTSNDICNC